MDEGTANVNVSAVLNAEQDPEVVITGTKAMSDGILSKKRKVTVGDLLKTYSVTAGVSLADSGMDELDDYLSQPLASTEIKLLQYWKNNESRWPKLAKMAKQYLAAPASTAGVERVFSAAGKMHDNLRKSMKDSTLEHSLFAAFNIE